MVNTLTCSVILTPVAIPPTHGEMGGWEENWLHIASSASLTPEPRSIFCLHDYSPFALRLFLFLVICHCIIHLPIRIFTSSLPPKKPTLPLPSSFLT